MGVFKEMRDINKSMDKMESILAYDTGASFSDYEIVMLLTNMSEASKLLDGDTYELVNKKFTEFRMSRIERMYQSAREFRDRVAFLACDYSEYCDVKKVFFTDYLTGAVIDEKVSDHIYKVEQIFSYLKKLEEYMFEQAQHQLNPACMYVNSVYYYSAIASILINGNRDSNSRLIKTYLNRETHNTYKDMIWWHAIRRYKNWCIAAASVLPQGQVENAVSQSENFFRSYESIMRSTGSELEKCRKIGMDFYSICGRNVVEDNERNNNLRHAQDQFLETISGLQISKNEKPERITNKPISSEANTTGKTNWSYSADVNKTDVTSNGIITKLTFGSEFEQLYYEINKLSENSKDPLFTDYLKSTLIEAQQDPASATVLRQKVIANYKTYAKRMVAAGQSVDPFYFRSIYGDMDTPEIKSPYSNDIEV